MMDSPVPGQKSPRTRSRREYREKTEKYVRKNNFYRGREFTKRMEFNKIKQKIIAFALCVLYDRLSINLFTS